MASRQSCRCCASDRFPEVIHNGTPCARASFDAREMLATRSELPDVGFLSCPGFLVGRKARARYNQTAIGFASDTFAPVR